MRTSFTSGDWTLLQKFGDSRRMYPLPRYPEAYAFEQDYTIKRSSFTNLVLNTPDSVDTNAILVGESQQRDIRMEMTQWARTYQRVPKSWDDYKVTPYTFPGFPGIIGQTGSRNVFTDAVSTRLHYDYYVLDPDDVLGSGCTAGAGPANASAAVDAGGSTAIKCVNTLGDIPIITKSIFVIASGGTPDWTNRTLSLIVSGGATIGGASYYQTLPTKGHYQSWISAADTYGWQSLEWDGSTDSAGTGNGYGQLVAQDSTIEQLAGNIYARITMYVLAR